MELGEPCEDGGKWYRRIVKWSADDLKPDGVQAKSIRGPDCWGEVCSGMEFNSNFAYRVPCDPSAPKWECPEGWRVLGYAEDVMPGDTYTHDVDGTPCSGGPEDWISIISPGPYLNAGRTVEDCNYGHGFLIRRVEAPKPEPQYLHFTAYRSKKSGQVCGWSDPVDYLTAISQAESMAAEEEDGDTWLVLRAEIIGHVQPVKYVPLK